MAITLATAGVTQSSECLPRTVRRSGARSGKALFTQPIRHIVIYEMGPTLISNFEQHRCSDP